MKLIKSGIISRSKIHHEKKYKDATPRPIQKDFNKIYDDVESKGQLKPVCVDDNWNLIDGYTMDEILGKQRIDEIKYEQWFFDSEDEKFEYIDSMNRKRRHLTEYQKFEKSLQIYEKEVIEAKKREKSGTLAPQDARGKATTKAAKEADMSTTTYERALTIHKRANPEQKQKVRDGKTGIKTLAVLLTRKDRNLPKAKMPKQISDVVHADVPIGFNDKGGRGAAENHYSTMTPEELGELEIPIADNAVCFFWMSPSIAFSEIPVEYKVGNKSLMINIPVYKYILNKWGFTIIKGAYAWDKEKIGVGTWMRNQHEICFIGIKGTMPAPAVAFSSIIREKRTQHSKKPEEIFKRIEAMFPGRNYLGLFERKARKGWKVFGNEISNSKSSKNKKDKNCSCTCHQNKSDVICCSCTCDYEKLSKSKKVKPKKITKKLSHNLNDEPNWIVFPDCDNCNPDLRIVSLTSTNSKKTKEIKPK